MAASEEDLYLSTVVSEQVKEIVNKESKSKVFYDPDGEDTDDEEWRLVDDSTREKWRLRARTHRPYSRKPLEKARQQCGRHYSLAYEIYREDKNLPPPPPPKLLPYPPPPSLGYEDDDEYDDEDDILRSMDEELNRVWKFHRSVSMS